MYNILSFYMRSCSRRRDDHKTRFLSRIYVYIYIYYTYIVYIYIDTHIHNAHTDTHILLCITAGDVGGLVAPEAAACRGGDDDDTRVKHFSPDL